MPSVISGPALRIASRVQGRTALVVGTLVLLVSGGNWVLATGILHSTMIDLDTYYRAALAGHQAQSRIYTQSFGGPVAGPFLYPPFAAMLVMTVDFLGLTTLSQLLCLVSFVSLLAAVYVVLRKLAPSWDRMTVSGWTLGVSGLALWLDPIERTFTFGQVSLLLLALVIVDLTRPDSSRWKGVGVGLAIAIKLTPAIFVLYLLCTKRFRASVMAVGVFLATVVVGWLALPIASPKFWFSALTRNNDQINDHTTVGDSTSQSIRAMLYRFLHDPTPKTVRPGHDSALLNPLWMLLCLIVVAAGMYAAVGLHRRRDELGALCVVAATGLLVSPISWTHHWVWILPGLIVLTHRAFTTGSRLLTGGLVATVLLFLAYPMRLIGDGTWHSIEPWTPYRVVPWRPYSIVWTTPHQDGKEFHWNAWDFLVGNLYVFAALIFIGTAAWLAWARRNEPLPDSASTTADQASEAAAPLGPIVRAALARLRTRRVFEPVAVAFGSAAVLYTRLSFPNQVGVADNSDGSRLLCHFNLVSGNAGASLPKDYASFTYVVKTGRGCSATKYWDGSTLPHPAYESSQLILMQLGKWATRLFGLQPALDLRALALVACLLIGTALGLLFAALRCRPLARYGLCAALLLVTADASFIDFAASPLSEISAIIGLLFLLPAIVLLVRGGPARQYGLVIGLAAGLFLSTSKAQMLFLAFPIAVFLAAFPLEATVLRGRLALTGRVGRRVLPALTGLALIGGTVIVTPAQDAHADLYTKGNFVFLQLLRTSPDPAADMASLGIPSKYSELIGQGFWCKPFDLGTASVTGADGKTTTVPTSTVPDAALAHGIDRTVVAKFLATHPDRTVNVLNAAADDFFHVRPTYSTYCPTSYDQMNLNLGNYAASSGKAPNSVDPIAPVTAVFSLFKGFGLVPLLVLWFAPFGVALRLVLRRRNRARGDGAAAAWATALLTIVATAQFAVATFGDGSDTAKHLNLSIYASALAVVLAAAAWLLRGRGEPDDGVVAGADAAPAAADARDAGGGTTDTGGVSTVIGTTTSANGEVPQPRTEAPAAAEPDGGNAEDASDDDIPAGTEGPGIDAVARQAHG